LEKQKILIDKNKKDSNRNSKEGLQAISKKLGTYSANMSLYKAARRNFTYVIVN